MKQTAREKDVPDRRFLRELLVSQGVAIEPPIDGTIYKPTQGHWLQRLKRWLAKP